MSDADGLRPLVERVREPSAAETGERVARVVLDSPLPQLDRLFDYAIPEALAADVAPGVRVRVPVRSQGRMMDGFVVELAGESAFGGALAELDSAVSPVAVLDGEVWSLARRLADRTAGVAADVLRLAIPKRRVRVETSYFSGPQPALPPVAPVPIERYPEALLAPRPQQRPVVLRAIPEPNAWIRTIVQLATQHLAVESSVIVVIPDQRDVERFTGLAATMIPPERIVRLDAAQRDAERYRNFLRARFERGILIVGGRAAVTAPAQHLGLIAIWDDGDPMLHEPHAPGVHARDVALVRQELGNCGVVLVAHAPSVEAERFVEIGFAQGFTPSGRTPRVIPTALQAREEGPASRARIPSSVWRAAQDALRTGPVLLQVSRPGEAESVGSERTAADLGRAFPRARIVVADAAHPVAEVGPEPAIVIATRGAEPVAEGGYHAVLLLDGERMLARESLRVAEDAVRTWANAIALAAPGAPSHLVGVGGRLARFLSTWRLEEFARDELAARRALRMPPVVRSATVLGTPVAVEEAIAAAGIPGEDVIAPVRLEDGLLRSVIRFDYRRGAEVATALRAEILRHSTGRRGKASGRADVALRVRFDDPEPFGAEGFRSPRPASPSVSRAPSPRS